MTGHGQLDHLTCLQQCSEWLGEVSPFNGAVLADVELLEETLVDLTTDAVRRTEVRGLAVAGRSQCPVKGGFNVGSGDLGGLDRLFQKGSRQFPVRQWSLPAPNTA
ncbi:hypothetical protein [Amycolatopsis balhimycina]|uniref:hypothetical protein n=1 Tax=Amycolatopsis balhimycina TaxID=208443 RepID=UPI000F79C30F|nr:hypothetical protein [Amycolatopsis balhimycina]